jgi:hypothetical protein
LLFLLLIPFSRKKIELVSLCVPVQHFTYENWIWAFTMLFSRAIRLRSLKEGETLALVPYADLINHSPFSQAYIDARENGDWLFKSGDEEVILYADRGYRRMEQVRTAKLQAILLFGRLLSKLGDLTKLFSFS